MTSVTSHEGHPHACPHERQVRKFDHPRRLSRTIALRASVSASCVRGCSARRGLAHVDDLDGRQAGAVDARRQAQARQRVNGLGARGRAARHEDGARLRGAALGHAARVVARVALVLVGRVVLLVDDDQPQTPHRGEDGRARTDAHARLPRPQPRPLVVALARRELRVQDGDRVAEARDEARHDLRGQRDLGDEHDHPAAVRQDLGGGPEIDLGLARPGDAVQQQPLTRRGRDDGAQRRRLVGGQLRLGPRGADGDVQGRAAHDARGDLDEPARLEASQRREIRAGEAGQRVEQRALAVGEPRRSGLLGGAARRGVAARRGIAARPGVTARPSRAAPPRPQGGLGPGALRRQQERERARRGRAVLGRHPQREVDELGGQPRLEHAARRDRVVLGAVGQPGHHADDLAMAKGNDEHRAHVDAVGAQVVERPAQRAGRRERLDVDYRWHRSPR